MGAVVSMGIDLLCAKLTSYVVIIYVFLCTVHTPRADECSVRIGLGFRHSSSDPDFVLEVRKPLLHCQASMAHGQLFDGVLIFVDLLEHHICMLDIARLELHRQSLGILRMVSALICRHEACDLHREGVQH